MLKLDTLSCAAHLPVLLLALLAARGEEWPLGRGVSGRACLSACADRWHCLVDTTDKAARDEPCYILQYYTQRYDPGSPLCVGPCQPHPAGHHWCAINETDTDYCNPTTKTELIAEYVTDIGPCKGPCTSQRGSVSCETESGVVAACTTRHFVRAHSTVGAPCLDRCVHTPGRRAMYCHVLEDGVEALWTCAPPARFYTRVPKWN